MKKNIFISFVIFLFIISCGTNKINKILLNPTKLDTVYVLFENGIGKMNKFRSFQTKNHDPKYYKIHYNFPVYWKQPSDPDMQSFLFEGDYNYSFWFGTYTESQAKALNFSEIWGNSTILKKHKSFLKNHEIIDYNWIKQRDPDEVIKALDLKKSYRERPVFFIIDIDEFEKDSIVLRNAVYHGPIIE